MTDTKTQKIPNRPFKFLMFVSKPYKLVAFLALLAVVVAASLEAVVPFVFKRIIDVVNGVSGFGPENIWLWTSVYIAVGFAAAMSWRSSGFAGMLWSTGVRAHSREKLMEYVTRHGYSFFSNRFAGAIGTQLRTASEGVKDIVGDILWSWLGFSIQLAISLGLVFYTNTYIGIIFIAWLLILTPINTYLFKKKVILGIKAQESDTRLTAQTIDTLTNINAMHDYARRDFELSRNKELINIRRIAGLKNWRYSEIVLTLNSALESFFVAGLIFSTIYLWTIGFVTAGDIILVITMVIAIRGNLGKLGQRFNEFAEKVSQVKEGLSEILREHEIQDSPSAKNLVVIEGEIVFDNITFKYESNVIFNKLFLKIAPGQRVGLIGRSGAGKSTLMKLLTRQYDVSDGKILIDEQDITQVKQESLRESIAVVPQEPLLFHRSLKENIRYGNLASSDEDIIDSSKQAQAHQFINSLPKKYDTMVGERGVKLSGGERQRVAISRAFLKNAKILLLDEATSALDSESEKMIQASLEKLMVGKTVIAIAHRLSTLRAMDRIVVLDKGKIIEDGTHDQLLERGGIYAELWAHQAGGFLKED